MRFRNITILLAVLLAAGCGGGEEEPRPGFTLRVDDERMMSINRYLTEKDKDIIEHFIRRQGWNMRYCADGYYYEILDPGAAPKFTKGDQVRYDYTVKLLDGTLCYTSEGAEPAAFVVGGSEEVSGMHLAAQRLGKGGKARFIFPPQLAHGLRGDLNRIPRRAVLVYHVSVNPD